MTPKHPVPPQKSRLPYKVSVEKNEVQPGEEVVINISGKVFKGFFLQVREGD
ncbi:Reeler domain-containing protein, partial [Nocardioides abyssi]|uniref:Reeler domain-containing protein n=1 Tax=Nocardioides abyssi TaxID=3058370 RepID=UPI0034E0107E